MSNQLQRLKLAAQALLANIDASTDCMSNQIKRENIDDWMSVLEAIVKTIGEPMLFQVQELRPEVLAFALLMETRLREKDADKGQSWRDADIGNLQVCATVKTMSIDTAITYGTNTEAARHAVDLANYAMMIADVAGVLEQCDSDGGAGWAGLDLVQMS